MSTTLTARHAPRRTPRHVPPKLVRANNFLFTQSTEPKLWGPPPQKWTHPDGGLPRLRLSVGRAHAGAGGGWLQQRPGHVPVRTPARDLPPAACGVQGHARPPHNPPRARAGQLTLQQPCVVTLLACSALLPAYHTPPAPPVCVSPCTCAGSNCCTDEKSFSKVWSVDCDKCDGDPKTGVCDN